MDFCKPITYLPDFEIFYTGPSKEVGPLPAFFYFALSAEDSLSTHPYNQPAQILQSDRLRIFSFTLPCHFGSSNKHQAMSCWAENLYRDDNFLENFLIQATAAVDFLVKNDWVEPTAIGVGGLSRGGFIATHLAARIPLFHTLIAFAPLTDLKIIEEFIEYGKHNHFQAKIDTLRLIRLIDRLDHIRNLRFYIGNYDTRVSTDACYAFISALAKKNHEKRLRNNQVELIITQSIGHKGHGTSPAIFAQGALWLKQNLIGCI